MTTKVRPALVELTIIRTKEFLRETEAVFWVFGFPIILALALGFAFRDKAPDKVPVAVLDASQLPALAKSPTLIPRVMNEAEAHEALRHGKVSLVIANTPGGVVYRFDPTRPESLAARRDADDALQRAKGRRDAIGTREEHVKEQGARYIDFLLPGLLGMNLMGTGMWGMGFTIANARMKKLLKRMIATPMRKTDYLLAQFLSRLFFLVVEVAVLVAFGWLVFGVRVSGSLLLLVLTCIIGGYAFSCIGLLTVSRAKTIEGVSGMMNLIMVPMWICSGIFFSYERFPDTIKPVIRALPLTLLNDALRAVINDAAGMAQLAPYLLGLIAWGVVTFVIGLKIFRWQ